MKQSISKIWLTSIALLLLPAISKAESIELKSIMENATVKFYALQDGKKGGEITNVEAGTKYVLADIQPAKGYWTSEDLLMQPENLADIGKANTRGNEATDLVSFSEKGTIERFGELQADGGGLYKLGLNAFSGIKSIVLDGYMAEQVSLDAEEVTINGKTYQIAFYLYEDDYIYNGEYQAPDLEGIALNDGDEHAYVFLNGSGNFTQSSQKDGKDVEASTDAGTYIRLITATADGCLKGTKSIEYTIAKAPLTVKVVGEYTRKQGEENPTEFTLEYEGFINNETEEVLTKKPVVTCAATKDSEPGEYEITISGAEAPNYDISYVSGKLTIEEPELPDNVFEEGGVKFEIQEGKESVTIIGDENASGVYVIPSTVSHNGVDYQVNAIGEDAFKDNTDLKEVIIPEGVMSIGNGAFARCTGLTTVTMLAKDGEITIGAGAFKDCEELTAIAIYLTTPGGHSTTMTRAASGSSFDGINKEVCVLYVPANSIEEYRNADGWKEFKNINRIGDTNNDTVINAADIVEETNFIMGKPSEKFVKHAADMNGDGMVNETDVTQMSDYIMSEQ